MDNYLRRRFLDANVDGVRKGLKWGVTAMLFSFVSKYNGGALAHTVR